MKQHVSSTTVLFAGTVLIFAEITKGLFNRIYDTSTTIIDEAFHLPQGQLYCNYTFNKWDPKITTLPGLYLVSMLIFAPLQLCSAYWLRMTNFVGSLVNLVLFYQMFSKLYGCDTFKSVFSALNLALLPPLYFFSHVYYTDVWALTAVLLMIYLSDRNEHFLAALSGAGSILMRQTSVIWVVMVGSQYYFNAMFEHCFKTKSRTVTENDLFKFAKRSRQQSWRDFNIFAHFPAEVWLNLTCYGLVAAAFVAFLLWNGGIVVGDKSAHQASLHVPQLLYYGLFTLLFGLPHVLPQGMHFVRCSMRRPRLVAAYAALAVCAVQFNTLVHPYLLADNRHYTFYVWHRLLRYPECRMLLIPVYLFALFAAGKLFYRRTDVFRFATYFPCVVLALCLQRMIEVRYFLVPFAVWRLQVSAGTRALVAETLLYLAINVATFYVFFTKDIWWDDFEDAQKLIW